KLHVGQAERLSLQAHALVELLDGRAVAFVYFVPLGCHAETRRRLQTTVFVYKDRRRVTSDGRLQLRPTLTGINLKPGNLILSCRPPPVTCHAFRGQVHAHGAKATADVGAFLVRAANVLAITMGAENDQKVCEPDERLAEAGR